MNPHIAKALEHLNRANYAGYFEEMDKVSITEQHQTAYTSHKGMFITGQTAWNFSQMLTTLAKLVAVDATAPSLTEGQTLQHTPRDYKAEALDLLLESEVGDALKIILAHTRDHKMFPTVMAVNVSYKEYEKDKLAGKNTQGQLQDITSRLAELIKKL